jgi:hypothetical protein
MLLFVVALQSPAASKSWLRVSQLFERTLRSICQQTSDQFRVFVVCNEWPNIVFFHPAITVIEEDFPVPSGARAERMVDKWRKLKRGMIAARRFAPAYVMFGDADDCVHRNLAKFVEQQPDTPGWCFTKGYLHHERSRWLYFYRRFHYICGTSAIVHCSEKDFPEAMDAPEPFILRYGHGTICDYLQEQRTPLKPLPFVGAVYNLDTGENDSGFALRQWRGKRMFLKKIVNSRLLTARKRTEFCLYDLPAQD